MLRRSSSAYVTVVDPAVIAGLPPCRTAACSNAVEMVGAVVIVVVMSTVLFQESQMAPKAGMPWFSRPWTTCQVSRLLEMQMTASALKSR